MILESVISLFLLSATNAQDAAGYPVTVQWTPSQAPVVQVDSISPWSEEFIANSIWKPEGDKHGTLHFRWNKYNYEDDYLNNAEAADKLRKLIDDIGREHIDSVVVTAYASPEGAYEHNMMLCRKRAEEFDRVVKDKIGLGASKDSAEVNIIVRPGGEAWDLLHKRIEEDPTLSDTGRKRIIKLLDNNAISHDTKNWRLEHGKLGSTRKEGDLYRWMLRRHYRYLRSLEVKIYVHDALVAFDAAGIDVVPEEPTSEIIAPPSEATELFDSTEFTGEIPEPGVSLYHPRDTHKCIDRLEGIRPEPLACRQGQDSFARRNEPKSVRSQQDSTGQQDSRYRPILGLSTNLIYDIAYVPHYGLTSIPSLSLEYYPSKGNITVGADVEWPQWTHPDEHRYLQIHNVTLWGRYYFRPEEDRFNGPYVLANLNGVQYGLGWDEKGWKGEGLGLSVGAGWKWHLGRRIYVDLGLALGAFYSGYDPYVWGGDATGWYYYDYSGDPDKFSPRSKRLLWGGPTRAYVSIGIDLFNRYRNKKK